MRRCRILEVVRDFKVKNDENMLTTRPPTETAIKQHHGKAHRAVADILQRLGLGPWVPLQKEITA